MTRLRWSCIGLLILQFLFSLQYIKAEPLLISDSQYFASTVWRDDFLRLPDQPAGSNFKLQQDQPQMPISIRGDIEALVSVPSDTLTVAIVKQDFNLQEGSEAFALFVIDSFDNSVAVGIASDDGDTSASGVFGPVTQKTVTFSLPGPGVYRLRTNASRDARFALVVDAPFFGLPSTIELLNPDQSTELYFFAPPEEVELRFRTQHLDGVNQTISLFDSSEQLVGAVEPTAINRGFTILADVSPEQAGALWRLSIPKSDVLIEGGGFDLFYLDPKSAYPFPPLEGLLLPRTLTMVGAPGAAVPFQFRVENDNEQPLSLLVSAQTTSGAPLTFENLSTAPINISGATTMHLPLFVGAAQNARDGSSSQFELTLSDPAGTPIIRANGELILKSSAAAMSGPPYVFFDDDRLREIRDTGLNGPQAMRNIHSSALRFGDAIVNDDLRVIDQPAGWTGRYISDGVGDGDDDPNDGDGAPLIYDPFQPTLHISSSDGRVYQGDQYDEGWRGFYHSDLSNRLRGLGLAYGLDPKPEYAQKAREMLLDYATRYNSWPLDDFLGNVTIRAARITTETLGEAIWLHRIALAYSLLRWDSAFSNEDRIHIEENLVRPAAEIIRRNPMGIVNWQSWHNAAVGLSGYILNDESMVEFALRGENGLQFLIDNAIREDGLWFEGSVGYHFFALLPLHLLMEAAEAHGESVYGEQIELAHASVLDLVYPDGTFPDLNNSTNNNVYSRDTLYEFCNAHYDNPVFDEILTFIYEELGRPRSDVETLYFGRGYGSNRFSPSPVLKDRMGNAILRTGNQLNDLVTLMDFGPHGEAHGHFDKLHVSLFGQGAAWLPDIGAVVSSQPAQEGWFRRTISHNAIIMGEVGQTFDTEFERPIGFYSAGSGPLQVMRSEISQPVYSQGSVDRAVVQVDDDYIIIIDHVDGGPAPYDFAFQSLGAFGGDDGFAPFQGQVAWANSQTGYQWLDAPRIFNQGEAPSILQTTSSDMMRIQARHGFGFADDCESLTDWRGNVGLSADAAQGESSLQWIVIPRGFNSIGKSFEVVNQNARAPQQLTFDYKIEAATFSEFSLSLNGLLPNQRAHFVIGQHDELTIGEWRQAQVDLTQPSITVNDPLRTSRLDFRLTGASGFEGFYRILIDNIQTWSDGAPHRSEERGMQLLFAGGEDTQYILAQGPSQLLPRTHPVIIARRDGVTATRHIVVAEPFLEFPTVFGVLAEGGNSLIIEHSEGVDFFEYDLLTNQYSIDRNGGATPVADWPLYE